MITLFIDTSSCDVSIALIKDNVILESISSSVPFEHSVYTVSYIDEVLKKSSIDSGQVNKIVVVNGPGSFTGIRIGVTIAKVYAYLKNIPIICVSSLKIRALSANGNYILSLIDAHHNNYYMGLYDVNYNDVIKEGFYKEDDVLKVISKYSPVIVSDLDINNGLVVSKSKSLDVLKIIDYYKGSSPVNPHLANPNYLKLPQVLEDVK